MFEVGQKVVCVNNEARPTPGYLADMDGLQRGSVYTVREIEGDVIWLAEIMRKLPVKDSRTGRIWLSDGPFGAFRFSPVKTTNIDIFLKMLEPTPETV